MKVKLSFILIIILLFTGCSKPAFTEQEYTDFVVEFDDYWDGVSEIFIQRMVEAVEQKDLEESEEVTSLIADLKSHLILAKERIPESKKESYDKMVKATDTIVEIEKLIEEGKLNRDDALEYLSELKDFNYYLVVESGKLPEEIVENMKQENNFENQIESYMKEFNVYFRWEDVQYDKPNNLEIPFVVAGIAELDDYYNYGFNNDIEKDYFCTSVTPPGGSYTDRWYLYFHRDSFKDLFNELKKGNRAVITTSKIPKSRYKKGQGNMAEVEHVQW